MSIKWTMELEDATSRGAAGIKANFKTIAKVAEDAIVAIDEFNRAEARGDSRHTKQMADAYVALAASIRDVTGAKQDLIGLNEKELRQRLESEGRELYAMRRNRSMGESGSLRNMLDAFDDMGGGKRTPKSPSDSGGGESGGTGIVTIAKYAAQMNLLPRGYEMQTVRQAQLAESLLGLAGRYKLVAGAVGIAGVAVTSLTAGFDALVRKGDPGATRLNAVFGELADTLTNKVGSAITSMYNGLGDIIARVPGVRQATGFLADLAEEVNQGVQFGSGEWAADRMYKEKAEAKRKEDARLLGIVRDQRAARDQDAAAQRDADRQFGAFSRGGATRSNIGAIDKRLGELKSKEEVFQVEALRLGGITDEAVKANPQLAELAKRLDEIGKESKRLADLRFKLIDDAAVERAKAVAKHLHEMRTASAEMYRIQLELDGVQRRGFNLDTNKLFTMKDVNKEIALTQDLLSRMYDRGEVESVGFKVAMHHMHELVARRREEEQHVRSVMMEQRNILLEMGNIAVGVVSHNLDRELSVHREIVDVQKRRVEQMRAAGAITNAEADARQRALAVDNKERENLEKKHKLQREMLEAKKKEVELSKQQAKTVEEHRAAEARQRDLALQEAHLMAQQQRELLAVEDAKAKALREQQRIEEERRMQVQMDAVKKAMEEQQRRMGGGVMDRIRESASGSRVDAAVIKGRVDAKVAERQKELGRKLRASERAKIGRDVRMDVMREKRGPSERQIAIERGKMLKAQRDKIRKDAKAAGKSPAEIRELERQAIRGDVARNNARQGELGAVAAAGLNRPIQDEREKAALALQRQAANSVDMDAMSRQVVNQVLDAQEAALNAWQQMNARQQKIEQQLGILIEETNRGQRQRAGQ